MVDREGQHSGWLRKVSSKDMPSSLSRELIWVIFCTEARSRSSTRTKMMLGLSPETLASSSWSDLSSPEQPATKKVARHARITSSAFFARVPPLLVGTMLALPESLAHLILRLLLNRLIA